MTSFESPAIRTLRLRVKDKHATWLAGLAREVNTVFNYRVRREVALLKKVREQEWWLRLPPALP